MSPFALVMLVGFALVVLWSLGALPNETRLRLRRSAMYLAIAALLLVLLRVGMPWLAALGAFLVAGVRLFAGPLLRLSPLILAWYAKRKLTGQAQPGGPGDTDPQSSSRLTRAEALAILGLDDGVSPEEIRKAHAELIKRVHPDRGGSSYLATRVNLARDRLLSKEER